MRERDIENYLVRRVKELGGEIRKVKWLGRNGAPDRLVMLPHRRVDDPPELGFGPDFANECNVWVELKAPGVRAKPHQLREHERMRRFGLQVAVVDSFEGVDALLLEDWANA